MRHLDLFSGIGGFALAARHVWGQGHKVVAFCEIDPFCRRILKKHWPEVRIINDVHDIYRYAGEMKECPCGCEEPWRERHGDHFADCGCIGCSEWDDDYGPVDILTGGFPCQPVSYAGHRRGGADERFLWPEMRRIIQGVRPRWVVGENVAGLASMGLDDCIADLEADSYETAVFNIPALAVGAEHERQRLWIIAYDTSLGVEGLRTQRVEVPFTLDWKVLPLRDSNGQWEVEPDLCRTPNGLPRGLDAARLKALGNAIVPQIAAQILTAIRRCDENL